MNGQTPDGLSVHALRHLLAVAENEAALALSRSTKALIEWANAESAHDEKWIDTARERFDALVLARLRADAKVDYLRKELQRATGRAA